MTVVSVVVLPLVLTVMSRVLLSRNAVNAAVRVSGLHDGSK